jgi:hypothetical protein
VRWVSGGRSVGAAGFCGPCVHLVACYRDCRGLWLFKVGTVGWSAGGV